MGKNICIFSDGTGQGGRAKAKENSNVFRLWQACETPENKKQGQVCSYDAGLGAPNADWWRWGYNLVSQATGLGISQNIKDCYNFVLEQYEEEDRIFLFGFSRGAYTVRSLGGVMRLCGVPKGCHVKGGSEAAALRRELVEHAVETVYKHGSGDTARDARERLGRDFRSDHRSDEVAPFFIGVWDTVRALGIPGSSGMVFWRHAFHDARLDGRVRYARQALSIDENREVFAPVIWNASEKDIADGRIKQRWFCGVHADIGGGYEDDRRLADITLAWMISEATEGIADPTERLLVDRSEIAAPDASHALALQHDQRSGWGRLWREGTREAYHEGEYLPWATLADPSVMARLKAAEVPYLGERKGKYKPRALASRFQPDWTLPP